MVKTYAATRETTFADLRPGQVFQFLSGIPCGGWIKVGDCQGIDLSGELILTVPPTEKVEEESPATIKITEPTVPSRPLEDAPSIRVCSLRKGERFTMARPVSLAKYPGVWIKRGYGYYVNDNGDLIVLPPCSKVRRV